jgi:hypothetical protein
VQPHARSGPPSGAAGRAIASSSKPEAP